jgi:hypothetical protein
LRKRGFFITAVVVFICCVPAAALGESRAELQEKIDRAVVKIRANPADFGAWMDFRDNSAAKGLPEDEISKFEPIFIALCDNRPYSNAASKSNPGTLFLIAVILPGKNSGFYAINDPARNSHDKLKITSEYVKKLYWYNAYNEKVRFVNPQLQLQPAGGSVETGMLTLGACRGEIVATCPFIPPGEADEMNQDWRDYYRTAYKKDRSLSKLTWVFLSKNRHVWGIGYGVAQEVMLPGQPQKCEARVELISKTSNGSCRTALIEAVR